jgi:hypothetical protein
LNDLLVPYLRRLELLVMLEVYYSIHVLVIITLMDIYVLEEVELNFKLLIGLLLEGPYTILTAHRKLVYI